MIVDVENYWRFKGIKTTSMKARPKLLASFEADSGKSLAYAKLNNSTVNASIFWQFCFASPKSLGKVV